MYEKRKAGTPSYQLAGAHYGRIGNDAAVIIPLRRRSRPTAREMQDASMFKLGLVLGATASALVFVAILWLWVIPTMDGAVATAKQAYQMSAGVLNA